MGDSDISWSHHLTPTEEKFIISIETNGGSFFNARPPRTATKPLACPCQPVQGDRTRQDCPRPSLHLQPGKLHAWAPWGKGGGQHWRRGRMLLVTGGAGFIGSNLVAGLNEAGRT